MESAERVSNVLLVFTSGEPVLGVVDIARRLGIPKSAAHRTLTALCRSGLVRQDPATAKYRLGMRAVDLGLAALDHSDIRSAALPVLKQIVGKQFESLRGYKITIRAGDQQANVGETTGITVDSGGKYPFPILKDTVTLKGDDIIMPVTLMQELRDGKCTKGGDPTTTDFALCPSWKNS